MTGVMNKDYVDPLKIRLKEAEEIIRSIRDSTMIVPTTIAAKAQAHLYKYAPKDELREMAEVAFREYDSIYHTPNSTVRSDRFALIWESFEPLFTFKAKECLDKIIEDIERSAQSYAKINYLKELRDEL